MYRIYRIRIDEKLIDIVQALIGQSIELEGISYEDGGFQFFVKNDIPHKVIDSILNDLQSNFSFSYESQQLEDKNWNALWESDFQPVLIGDYCRIKAPFHESDTSFTHEVIVHPGMAFGTGHHETTWMMVDALRQLPIGGKKVLDAGCGTGVLAILASLEKALTVDAFDYDINSIESVQQNMRLNQVENISVYQSEAADFQGQDYDIICANINRNVILKSLGNFKQMLADKGMIIVSGYLEDDKILVQELATQLGLTLLISYQKGEWMCQVYQ